MNKNKIGLFIALLVGFTLTIQAQNITSLRINEVLITNIENFQDDYGQHNGWIEIFNTSYATVNIEGCYLTNDKENPTKYFIPKGDMMTIIGPRQHTLFWTDNNPMRGTFHVNFKLDPTKENYIALYASNGRTLIDEVTIPAHTLAPDHSYARKRDGDAEWVVKGEQTKSHVTPSTNNLLVNKNEKIENFRKHDNIGVGMSIIAMSVVFMGLILLYLSFKLVGKIAVNLSRRNTIRATGIAPHEAKGKDLGISGEVMAAIGMALHEQNNDVHDYEDMILTINRVKRNYSPWSSKFHNLRQFKK